MAFVLLLLATVFVVWHDVRTRRVPRRLSWFLLGTGAARVLGDLPSSFGFWRGVLMLWVLGSYVLGVLGGGDLRLWMTWILWTPTERLLEGAWVMGLSWFLGSLGVLLVSPQVGQRRPATWKVLPYAVWLVWRTFSTAPIP